MKKLIFILLVVMILPISAFADMIAVSEVRDQVMEIGKWTQSYEVDGKTVTVDVPIEVPDVDVMPVLRVADEYTYADAGLPTIPDGISVRASGTLIDGGMPYIGGNDGVRAWEKRIYSGRVDLNAILSSKLNMSAAEIVSHIENTIASCYGYDADICLEYISDKQEWREYDERTSEWGTVVNDASLIGKLEVSAFECVQGVPIIAGMLELMHGGTMDYETERGAQRPPVFYECTSEGWCLCYFGVRVAAVQYEDVPLCGFEVAKKQFEKLILQGNIKRVNAVRLGYVMCLDPKGGERWLVPMWVLDGQYARNANQKDVAEQQRADPEEYQRHYIGVNAQTGELIDPKSQGKKRCYVSDILTWQEVRK